MVQHQVKRHSTNLRSNSNKVMRRSQSLRGWL